MRTRNKRASAQIAIIEAQATDDEPDPVIIKQAGSTLRNITEGAIGSLVATAVQPAVWRSDIAGDGHPISQVKPMLLTRGG